MKKVVSYVCSVCGKSFGDDDACSEHEWTHSAHAGPRFEPGTLLVSDQWDWPGKVAEPGQWNSRVCDWVYTCALLGENMEPIPDALERVFVEGTVICAATYGEVKAAFDRAMEVAATYSLERGEKVQVLLDADSLDVYLQAVYKVKKVFRAKEEEEEEEG